MARDLNIPMWQLENECSEAWWYRYWAYIRACNKAANSAKQEKINING